MRDKKYLINYFKDGWIKGYSSDQINNHLIEHGYSRNDLKSVMESAKKSKIHKKSNKKLVLTLVFATILIFSIFAMFTYFSEQNYEDGEKEGASTPEDENSKSEIESCVNECLFENISECILDKIRTCGYYDQDSCLEWGLEESCQKDMVCENNTCIEIELEKTVIEKIEIDYSKIDDDFCKYYYEGEVIDGFCYTDASKTLIEPSAVNGVLIYTPYGSEVERTIEYPTSIEVINAGLNFEIKITLENKGSGNEKITFSNFEMKIFNMEEIQLSASETIQPGETKEITLEIDLPNSAQNWLPESSITFWDNYEDNTEGHTLPRIILYWEYDLFHDLPVSVEECGSRKYTDNFGVCLNDVLYPSIAQRSCLSDNDCSSKYPYLKASYRCYEYSCLDMGSEYITFDQDNNYRIGILPLYISDDESKYNNMKQKVEEQLGLIVPKMNDWFSNEREYWNTESGLEFEFLPIENGCKMSISEYQNIGVPTKYNSESDLKEIEKECNPNEDYDFLIISTQHENYFDPSFPDAGINYGTIMGSRLNQRTIIHELLHSFGEHDIYGSESYQWGNCYLYNANTGHNWNENMPHLCRFEAMQLGWFQKLPN